MSSSNNISEEPSTSTENEEFERLQKKFQESVNNRMKRMKQMRAQVAEEQNKILEERLLQSLTEEEIEWLKKAREEAKAKEELKNKGHCGVVSPDDKKPSEFEEEYFAKHEGSDPGLRKRYELWKENKANEATKKINSDEEKKC